MLKHKFVCISQIVVVQECLTPEEGCVTHHSNEEELEEGGMEGGGKVVYSFFCDLASVDSCTVFPLLGCFILWLLEISISSVNKKE